MAIGTMKKITLKEPVYQKDSSGTWMNEDPVTYNVYAGVKRISGSRQYERYQTQLNELYSFRVRFHKQIDINSEWKLSYDGKEFTVHEISRDNEKLFYWTIIASCKHG